MEENRMEKIRRCHTPAFKAKVALEAVKGLKTLSEISSEYGVHSVQVSRWKNELIESLPTIFTKDRSFEDWENEKNNLYRQIGEITVERDWLKKSFRT